MANDTTLDTALARIAGMLSGNGASAPVVPPAGPPLPPTNGTASALQLEDTEKGHLAEFVFHCMSMPPITLEKRKEMERGLPALVEALSTLHVRPTAAAELESLLAVALQGRPKGERSDADGRLAQLAETMRRDAFGQDERVIQLLALGVAGAMAGFVVVHNWGR